MKLFITDCTESWHFDNFQCSQLWKFHQNAISTSVCSVTIMDTSVHLNTANSLAPRGFDYNLKLVNFKLIAMINFLSIFCEIAIWMPQHLTNHYSTLVQVMAWCCQTTSHYLSQCWPRFLSPYDVTRPQWVKCIWNACIKLVILY